MKTLLLSFALAFLLAVPTARANGLPADTPPEGYDARQPAAYPNTAQPIPAPVPVPPALKRAPEWYAGVYGGANWAEDWGAAIGPFSINSDTDVGGVVGVFVGKRIPSVKGLSLEIEGNYRTADTSPALTIVAPPPVITFSGDDSTIALMANARYEFDLGGKVTPYILAGVGYGERTITLDLVPVLASFEQSKSDVVWQAGAGLDLALTEHMKLGVAYRYFDAPDLSQTVFGVVPFSADGENHAVVGTLTFALN